ncbi:MAG: biotin--[acetyl-CoA-carboxylase] ligase [Pseudomonadota bacterium]
MEPWPTGVQRRALREVDSTNAEAARMAAKGETGPVWITAEVQTRSRGRRGRYWASHTGNLHATFLFLPRGEPKDAALRSFTAALALYDSLIVLTGRQDLFALKWPNDVLLSGRKLAGILLELCAAPALYPQPLAVGIGVNLSYAPEASGLEDGALPPVSIEEATGLVLEPIDFLEVLAPAYSAWEARLASDGFDPIRQAWLSRATRLGDTVVARLPDREIRGVFRTIDKTGAILLDTEGGRVALPAAEIHFCPPGH